MKPDQNDLTTLDGLQKGLISVAWNHGFWTVADGAYCSTCCDYRRMDVYVVHWSDKPEERPSAVRFNPAKLPALFRLGCVQCNAGIVLVVHQGPTDIEVIALRSEFGGSATPNCPSAVAYYLDQAQRTEAVGASSAAVAMYRAALEQLLFERGYRNGMLAEKIDDLLVAAPRPRWLETLDEEFLRVVKDLGNAAIHPNGGDIEKQSALDATLLRQVRELFAELLDLIYEQPEHRRLRLAALRQAADSFHQDSVATGGRSSAS